MTFTMRETYEDDVSFIVRLFKLPHVRAFLNPPNRGTVLASLENPNVENYVLEEDGEPAGNFVLRSQGFLVEFSVLAVATQGRGAGSFVLNWGLHYVFGDLKAHRVPIEVREDNVVTRRLVERLGWVQEGLFRDGFRDAQTGEYKNLCAYGILAQEFERV